MTNWKVFQLSKNRSRLIDQSAGLYWPETCRSSSFAAQ